MLPAAAGAGVLSEGQCILQQCILTVCLRIILPRSASLAARDEDGFNKEGGSCKRKRQQHFQRYIVNPEWFFHFVSRAAGDEDGDEEGGGGRRTRGGRRARGGGAAAALQAPRQLAGLLEALRRLAAESAGSAIPEGGDATQGDDGEAAACAPLRYETVCSVAAALWESAPVLRNWRALTEALADEARFEARGAQVRLLVLALLVALCSADCRLLLGSAVVLPVALPF